MATRKYAYCQEPSKIILPLTAQKSLLSKQARIKTPVANSQDCLLGSRQRRIDISQK